MLILRLGLEDNPPVANGGSARVVQPQDGVTLNGIESHDDNGIETFQWQLVTGNPYAVIEVSLSGGGGLRSIEGY